MSEFEIIGLALAGAAGGAINAVAGGGTLVTFPMLLFYGTAPTVANATSTLALVIGTSGGLYGYRQHLRDVRDWLWTFIPVSVLGGFLGSVLLTHTSDRTFSRLVPFLILFATVLFLVQGMVRTAAEAGRANRSGLTADNDSTKRLVRGAVVFQFLVALYGGYFGAGIGILMLASLGFIGLGNIHQMNTLKTIMGSLINLVAAVWFICAGIIDWPRAAVMTVGALCGYFLGAHFSQRISQRRVRQIIALIGFVLSAVTFYKEFLR